MGRRGKGRKKDIGEREKKRGNRVRKGDEGGGEGETGMKWKDK